MSGASALAGAAAQAAIREEEESMTPYESNHLADEWEFKIVRSVMGSFKSPSIMQRVCEEESQHGWVLLEKFDDHRLRFKRHHTARDAKPDVNISIDPYRTTYGVSTLSFTLLLLIVIFGSILILLLGIAYFVN